MLTIKVESIVMAAAALEYVNRELVIPVKGVLDLTGGECFLKFDGLAGYFTTADKIQNAVNDFAAGWKAHAEALKKQHKAKLKQV